MNEAIAITGVGLLGPFGWGSAALRAALERGRCELSEVDRSAGWHLEPSARLAGLAPAPPVGMGPAPAEARRMSPASRMALAAARGALAEARWAPQDIASERTAVCLGTAFSSTSFTVKLLEQIELQGPQAASPFLFMETVANAHAGQVALALGARGPNATITQREVSGASALLRARSLLQRGAADRVLAGGVDELAPMAHAVLDRFGALARGDERARPFDARRHGCVASEGACVLALERESDARERGAHVLALLVGGARAFDPSASRAGYGSAAEALASELVRGLEREGGRMAECELVLSGANGSPSGDRLEARVLRAAFEGALPPVLAPKSALGEYGAAQLGALVAALSGERIDWPAPSGDFEPDPACGIQLALRVEAARDTKAPRRALATQLAAGGAAVWLLLEAAT